MLNNFKMYLRIPAMQQNINNNVLFVNYPAIYMTDKMLILFKKKRHGIALYLRIVKAVFYFVFNEVCIKSYAKTHFERLVRMRICGAKLTLRERPELRTFGG